MHFPWAVNFKHSLVIFLQLGANGYSFIVDNNGKVLYHPDLRLSVIKWHSIPCSIIAFPLSIETTYLVERRRQGKKHTLSSEEPSKIAILSLSSISIPNFFPLFFVFRRTINCNMSIHYNRNTVQSIWLKWSYPKVMRAAWQTVTWKGRMRIPTCCLMYVYRFHLSEYNTVYEICAFYTLISEHIQIYFCCCIHRLIEMNVRFFFFYPVSFVLFPRTFKSLQYVFLEYFPLPSFFTLLLAQEFIAFTWCKCLEEFQAWNLSISPVHLNFVIVFFLFVAFCLFVFNWILLCTKNYIDFVAAFATTHSSREFALFVFCATLDALN